ncbi:CinA family protein [Pokkaliibacter sp. CJK22405]|uniref:CinA family protein n=1 Tax=Pokkaliibacter sp. CJK22405 TaxID=3384615 RepID=UPI0039848F7F
MPESNAVLESLVSQLADVLINKQQQVATAESCTGGGLATAFTALPGSSRWFGFGWVTYANQAKIQMLGVQPESLQAAGAVSRIVVEEMAQGACTRSAAHFSAAISGIAGPDGGSEEKPVGTVWIAWSTPLQTWSARFLFPGNRNEVREAAAIAAAEGLLALASQAILSRSAFRKLPPQVFNGH